MKSMYLYTLTLLAFAGLATIAHAQQQPPQTASIALSDNVYTPGQTTISLGGKVSFGYADGGESHNVHFERGGAECTQFSGAAVGAIGGRALPAVAEAPGWSGECRFTQSGTYAFFCDDHADMTGKITVANADGTLPVEATPTPTPTATPQAGGGGGGVAQPTPTPAGSTPTPTTAAKATIAASQKGNAVAGWLTGGSARTTVTIEALAKRPDLRAKGKVKLVRVGKVTKTVEAGAEVRFSVPLSAKAKAALKRLRKLKLTVNLTIGGQAQARSVTLRVK
jgi:plastocyanin